MMAHALFASIADFAMFAAMLLAAPTITMSQRCRR